MRVTLVESTTSRHGDAHDNSGRHIAELSGPDLQPPIAVQVSDLHSPRRTLDAMRKRQHPGFASYFGRAAPSKRGITCLIQFRTTRVFFSVKRDTSQAKPRTAEPSTAP